VVWQSRTKVPELGQQFKRRLCTTRCFGLGPWTTHQKVFEDELAIASLERGTAPAADDPAIWRRVCLGTNNLVLGTAVWAVKAAGCFWHFETIADQRSKGSALEPEGERQKRNCLDRQGAVEARNRP